MDETEFAGLAERVLERIEAALEESGVDADVERKEGGVLEIEYADGSRMVINRHAAAREIWVAAPSGGVHFRWGGAVWRDTREGRELFSAPSPCKTPRSAARPRRPSGSCRASWAGRSRPRRSPPSRAGSRRTRRRRIHWWCRSCRRGRSAPGARRAPRCRCASRLASYCP